MCDNNIQFIGLLSSSSDYSQSISNTSQLQNPSEEHFWSSLGHQESEGTEFLIYKFNEPSLVTQVSVEFYIANYLSTKLYHSKYIKVYIGETSDKWIYEQEVVVDIDIQYKNNQFITIIDLDCLPFAQYMKVEFIGLLGKQEEDYKYYIAVRQVKVLGMNLCKYKQFAEIILEGCRNYKLKNSLQMHEEHKNNEINDRNSLIINKFTNYLQEKKPVYYFFEQYPEAHDINELYQLIQQDQEIFDNYFYGISKRVYMSEHETIIFILNKIKFQEIRNIFKQKNIFLKYENKDKQIYSIFHFDKQLLSNLIIALRIIQEEGVFYEGLSNNLQQFQYFFFSQQTYFEIFKNLFEENILPQEYKKRLQKFEMRLEKMGIHINNEYELVEMPRFEIVQQIKYIITFATFICFDLNE